MIHSTAVVYDGARVHPSAEIGPYAVIGPKVVIMSHVRVGAHSVIGGEPEHRDFYEKTSGYGVVLYPHARVFEHVTIHCGTKLNTLVGEHAAVFNHAHIAHDVQVHDWATVNGHCSLAGHVILMSHATMGGQSCAHQRSVIGPYSMVALGAVVKGNVDPGCKWIGIPARYAGLNKHALMKEGLPMDREILRKKFQEKFESMIEMAKL